MGTQQTVQGAVDELAAIYDESIENLRTAVAA